MESGNGRSWGQLRFPRVVGSAALVWVTAVLVLCWQLGAEQPPWSHTCRVLVQGGSLAGAAAAPQASIHCWTPGNSSPCAQPLEGFNQEQQLPSDPGQLLTVWAGAALYDALTANPVGGLAANPILCGVELRRRPQQLVTGSASSLFSALEDPVPTAGGGTSPPPGMPQPDWGVTFRGVPHLVLVDSVLTHLPLSPYGPLLQCAACQHLTIANLTMRRLAGPPAAGPGRPRVYGALHASGLRSVVASQVDCVNVTRAHGWACMLLQYACAQGDENNTTAGVGEGSYLMLRAGAFSGNAVVQAGPGQIVEGLGQLGWGAVVLTTDNSWVVGPAATAAAGQAALAQQPASPAGRRNADAAAAGLTAEGGAQKAAVAASAASAASLSSSSSAAAAAAAVVKTSTAQQELSLRSSCRLSSVELRDVDASGNAGGSGALLAVLDLNVASLRLVDSSVYNNGAVLAGGAIHVGSSSSRSNSAGSSGSPASSANGNGPPGSSGALLGDLVLQGTDVERNQACYGGVLSVAGNLGRLMAVESRLHRNFAESSLPSQLDIAAEVGLDWEGVGGVAWVGGSVGSLMLTHGSSVEYSGANNFGTFLHARGAVASIELDDAVLSSGRYTLISTQEGAVYTAGSIGSVKLSSSRLAGNIGGVLYALGDISSVTIHNSSIVNGRDSALFSNSSVGTVLVTNYSTVSYNAADYGKYRDAGGGLLHATRNVASLVITNGSSVNGNTALGQSTGGAVHVGGHLCYLEVSRNSSLSGNRARGNGGAVVANSLGRMVITDGSVVSGNIAGDSSTAALLEFRYSPFPAASGGAVYVNTTLDSLELSHGARMEGNRANQNAGAVFARLLWRLEVQSAALHNNTAVRGAGGGVMSAGMDPEEVVEVLPDSTALCDLAGARRQLSWRLRDAVVSGNMAGGGSGGGLLLSLGFSCIYSDDRNIWFRRQPDTCVTVMNSQLVRNSAAGGGGALAVHNPHLVADANVLQRTAPVRVSLHNATFSGNRAGRDSASDRVHSTAGAGQSGLGGALYMHVAPAWRNKTSGWWIENCVLTADGGTAFLGNEASDMGGAAALVWCAAWLGDGTRLEGNRAGASGGGLALLQDVADVHSRPTAQQGAWDADTTDFSIHGYTAEDLRVCGIRTARGTSLPAWLSVRNTTFERNTAQVAGGALFAQSAFPSSWRRGSAYRLLHLGANTTVDRNSAVRGGGVFAELQDSTALFDQGSVFDSNEANTGGGAFVAIIDGSGGPDSGGEGPRDESGSGGIRSRLQVLGSRWEGNSALQDGGGLYISMQAVHGSATAETGEGEECEAPPATVVRMQGMYARGNTAAGAGGAVCVAVEGGAALRGQQVYEEALARDLSPGCSSNLAPVVWVEGCTLEGNRAGQRGGALWAGPGSGISLSNTSVRGNTADAGPGGGVAAEGCAWLQLADGSEVAGNAAPRSTGGGVFAGGCGRVVLQGMVVRGNRALAGAGVHLDGEGTSGTGIAAGTLAVLERLVFADNAAELLLSGSAASAVGISGTNSSSSSTPSPSGSDPWVGGRGGALYVSGRVAAVLSHTDLSTGNTGVFGWGIATTQTCGSAQPLAPSFPKPPPRPPKAPRQPSEPWPSPPSWPSWPSWPPGKPDRPMYPPLPPPPPAMGGRPQIPSYRRRPADPPRGPALPQAPPLAPQPPEAWEADSDATLRPSALAGSPAWAALSRAARAGCWLLALVGDTRLPQQEAAEGVGVRVWSNDPSLPALHAACQRQQEHSDGPGATAWVTGGNQTRGGPTEDRESISGAITSAYEQLQEQHAKDFAAGGLVNRAGSGATLAAASPGLALRSAGLRTCLVDPIVNTSWSDQFINTSNTGSDMFTTALTGANLAAVVPACLGALLFRQQQVVLPAGVRAGDVATLSLTDSLHNGNLGAGMLDGGCYGGAGDGSSWLLLRAGVAFELRVQLYDSFGAPVLADVDDFTAQLDIQPAFLPANATLAPGAPSAFAILDSGLAAAAGQGGGRGNSATDQSAAANAAAASGARSSLLALRVSGGVAAWAQVVARGWPGEYRLVVSVASATGVYKVRPLYVAVRLLPCSVGDSLVPGWGSPDLPGGMPPWTSCQACGADQVGLWRDERQQLRAAAGQAGQGAWDVGNFTSEQLNATVQALLGRGGRSGGAGTVGAATCRNCPAGAQCPGGAVLVPQPGWWHSAANSTAIHRCPFPAACGGAGGADQPWFSRQSALAVAGVPPTMAQAHPRSRALASCQAAWYASGWRPGLWVVARVLGRGLLGRWAGAGPENGSVALSPAALLTEGRLVGPQQEEDLPCLLWYEPSLLADSTVAADEGGNGSSNSSQHTVGGGPTGASIRANRALQAGKTHGGNDAVSNDQQQQQQAVAWSGLSYMQLQCAEGYTGTLCAACQPGHYLQPGFECSPCPGVGRTLLLGLLAFAGSVGLVLVLAAFNLGQKEETDAGSGSKMPEAADVVKVALLYVQYAVVVFRLNIDYPNAITAVVSAASSLTWADALLGFSPACLAPGLGSGGQAAAQLLGSLLIPCGAVAASLGLWALRYAVMRWRPFSKDKQPGVPLMASSRLVSDGASRRASCGTHVLAKAPCLFRASGASDYAISGEAPAVVTAQPSASVLILSTTAADAPAPVHSELPTASNPASQSLPNTVTVTNAHTNSEAPDREEVSSPGSVASTSRGIANGSKRRLRAKQGSSSFSANRSSVVHAVSQAKSFVASRIRRSTSALAAMDRVLPLSHQLGVVLLIGVFVMYPSWVQAALGVFACYAVDSGEGSLYPENQRATWRHGYWVRDMTQQCYAGAHLRVFVPIGVASIVVFCFTPPLASFLLLWSVRSRGRQQVLQQQHDKRRPLRALLQLLRSCCGLAPSADQARPWGLGAEEARVEPADPLQDDDDVRRKYGFLYSRYRPRFWWWESVLLLQTLALVAAEVFGRTLPVERQALLLAAVLLGIAFANTVCVPIRCRRLVVLEFTALCALLLTLTLGVYLMGGSPMDGADADTVGAAILAVNVGALAALAYPLVAPHLAGATRKVAKAARRCCGAEAGPALSQTWPWLPSFPWSQGRRSSGPASVIAGQDTLQQLQLDVDGAAPLTLHGCPSRRPGGGQGTAVAAAEPQREVVELASGFQAMVAATQQAEGESALKSGVQGAGTGQ